MPKSQLRQQLNLSESVEDYLKAIYHLQEASRRAGDAEPWVSTTDLAAALRVAPGSVTGMVKKLADIALILHRPYRGVCLTAQGEQLALELVRHHRLIELYLTTLGFRWDEVHDQADALEHAISEELEDRLDSMLGHPTVDPHGDPIPPKDGHFVLPLARTLADLPGDPAYPLVIARVLTQDPALLRYLADLGLTPATRLALLHRDPFGGPVRLRLMDGDEGIREIGPQVAAMIQICEPEPPA